MTAKPDPTASPSRQEINRQCESMLASPDFTATPQQRAFLRYIVTQTLAGKSDRIKGYTVATEVFGRGSDFDQNIDPIVSIQAARLRRALKRYYEGAGQHDTVRIDIPKGTYVPTFVQITFERPPASVEPIVPIDIMQTWPTLLVQPLTNLTHNSEDDYLSIGLTTELAHALCHYREIRVWEALHRESDKAPAETDIDFVIDGNVRRDEDGITVLICLHDVKQGFQIWSSKFRGVLDAARMITFQEQVAAEVAVRISGDNAVISKHLAGIAANKSAAHLTTYEAMLRFWESDALLTPEKMIRAIHALENAVSAEPDNGQIWSMLAAQYADNYGLEIVDLPTPIEKAAAFAHKGVSLDPTNRRARIVLGYILLMQNELREARKEAEAAYNLCTNSLLVLDSLGWLMALAGGWEQGVDWVQRATRLNPYYRPWVRHVICFNALRLGDYEKAYRESMTLVMPDLFWEPLLIAALCGHLEKSAEGQAAIRDLLALKPDFPQRGRILIGRYIKHDDITARIIEGLAKAGLPLESRS